MLVHRTLWKSVSSILPFGGLEEPSRFWRQEEEILFYDELRFPVSGFLSVPFRALEEYPEFWRQRGDFVVFRIQGQFRDATVFILKTTFRIFMDRFVFF